MNTPLTILGLTSAQRSKCLRFLSRHRGALIAAVPTSCLALSLLSFGILRGKTLETNRWVKHTQAVYTEATYLQTALLDAETGVRGYDLTRKRSFLEPYERAIGVIPQHLDALESMVQDNSAQQMRVDRLADSSDRVLDSFRRNLDAIDAQRTNDDSLTIAQNAQIETQLLQSKAAMDDIREQMSEFLQAEQLLLEQRQADYERQQQQTWLVLVFSALAGGVASVLSAVLLRRMDTALVDRNRFFDLSIDLLTISGIDGYFKHLNPAASRILGFSPAELMSRPWIEFIHPDDRTHSLVEFSRLLTGAQAFQFENRYRHKDGSYRWLAWTAVAVPKKGLVYSVARDVTDRKQTEAALQQEREFSAVLVESFSEGVVACNAQGEITMFNRAARDWHGTDRQALPQTEWAQSYSLYEFDGVTPLTTDRIPLLRAFQGEVVRQVGMAIGAVNQPTRYILANASPLVDAAGQKIGAVAVMHDITDRKLVEDALERERQQLQQIVTHAPVAMAMLDRQMRYLAYSEKWLEEYNLPPVSLLGRNHYEVFPWLPPERHQIHQRALAGENLSSSEDSLLLADGSRIYIRWAVQPWYDPNGQIGGLIVATHRIDELVQAREAAVENFRLRSQFLANMSHEIRTPMNGVLGMAGLLLKTNLSPKQQEFVQAISTSGEHLLNLINDVLDFSKLEAGEMQLEELDFNLDDCIETVVDLLALQAQTKELELGAIVLPDVPRHLRGDSGRLRQVLLNLVSNAIKFTAAGEVLVRVALEASEGKRLRLRFEVIDTGIGISAEGKQKLFQSFSQVDASTTREYGGTGLGLVICQQLVELMGGQIGVDSEPGSGSTFWFTTVMQRAEPTGRTDPSQALSNLKILAADASDAVRQSIRSLAQAWGMQFHEVADGTTALTLLRSAASQSKPYDIVILDQHLSGIDGQTLMQIIQADPRLSDTRLVYMSPLSSSEPSEAQAQAGSNSILIKPVRASRLYDALLTAIAPQITQALQKSKPPSDRPLPQPLLNLKLLLAEDHPINQQVILNQLSLLGYQADLANNGEEALQLIQQQPYDLVLMDCQMPLLDGYETTRQIRRLPPRAAVARSSVRLPIVVALTAHAMPTDREKCLAAGMDDYLSKPVDQAELSAMLHRWETAILAADPSRSPRPIESLPVEDSPPPATTNGAAKPSEATNLPKPVNLPEPVNPSNSVDLAEPVYRSELLTEPIGSPTAPLDLKRLHSISKGKIAIQQQLLQTLLDRTQIELPEMRRAVSRNDAEALQHYAHRLKGSSANMGLLHVPALAAELEHLATQSQDFSTAIGLIDAVESHLQAVEQFLKEQLSTR